MPIVETLCAATGTCDSVRKAVASVECTAKHLLHTSPTCKTFRYIDGAVAGILDGEELSDPDDDEPCIINKLRGRYLLPETRQTGEVPPDAVVTAVQAVVVGGAMFTLGMMQPWRNDLS